MAEGRYLYAIARDLDAGAIRGVQGLDGVPVEAVEHRGLSAIVSTVDLAEYGEEALRRNLEDLAWLEKVARGHDTVIHAVAGSAATAPLRLATICLDDDGVRARLDEWHDALQAALDRVEGRAEWAVKAFARSGSAEESPASVPAGQETSGTGAGLAYLQRKKSQVQQQAQSQERAQQVAEEVHRALAERCVASRRLAPQDPRLTGHEGVMTLNGAYLVERSEGDAFAAAVRELAERHPDAHLTVAGPWPPYSFATLEQA
ncbi:MAG: GvpL/GvpF family gas vesicle protein [Actinomycetes bacterium]